MLVNFFDLYNFDDDFLQLAAVGKIQVADHSVSSILDQVFGHDVLLSGVHKGED